MELIKIITLLSLFFYALQPTFSSSQIKPSTSFQHQGEVNEHKQLSRSLSTLHRKLIFTKKVKESDEAKDLVTHKEKDSLSEGKQNNKKQNMKLGNKGTRQEWMEESDDPSQYFTMDYNRVRRRRPIHNKKLPDQVFVQDEHRLIKEKLQHNGFVLMGIGQTKPDFVRPEPGLLRIYEA